MSHTGATGRVPAEIIHCGDAVIIEKNGTPVPVRIVRAIHGSTAISNIVILYCQPDSNPDPDAQLVLPFASEALINRVRANAGAAA